MDVKQADLILGDKNAVLVASRILAYGPDYTVEVTNPNNIEQKIKFKLLTGADEALIEKDISQSAKYGVSSDITTRLRYTVIQVGDDSDKSTINEFTQNLLARDSVTLRNYIKEISPDIDLTSEVEIGGETVSVSIPLTVEFFWPQTI